MWSPGGSVKGWNLSEVEPVGGYEATGPCLGKELRLLEEWEFPAEVGYNKAASLVCP